MNGLREKAAFATGALSPAPGDLFEKFSFFLAKERGAEFAAHRILYFFSFFQEIDLLMEDCQRFPSFEQMLNHFSVVHTRKFLTAMHFFESEGLIKRDPKIQDIYANLDMIERYLGAFDQSDPFFQIIHNYYHFLDQKHTAGKITIRTVRLSLTPAVKFLRYCSLCRATKPNQTVLDGYLWCLPGQRNTLSGFISFYNREYGTSLVLSTNKNIPKTVILKSPGTSKKRREQIFIQMLRTLNREGTHYKQYSKEDILRIAIEYLHDVKIPKEGVVLSFLPIKQRKGEYFIRFARREFYMPNTISDALGSL